MPVEIRDGEVWVNLAPPVNLDLKNPLEIFFGCIFDQLITHIPHFKL